MSVSLELEVNEALNSRKLKILDHGLGEISKVLENDLRVTHIMVAVMGD